MIRQIKSEAGLSVMKKENNQEFYVEQMDVHYPLQSEIQMKLKTSF